MRAASLVMLFLLLFVQPILAIDPQGEQPEGPAAQPPARQREGGQAIPQLNSEPTEGMEEGIPDVELSNPRGRERWLGGWKLGVFAYNSPKGVVITRVLPNSPAARAGLEPRDRIVTVNGYQIGIVGHQLFPLGRELQLRADPRGRVSLLVQNCRTDQLENMDIRAERQIEPRRRDF